jgi:hypothetical protein
MLDLPPEILAALGQELEGVDTDAMGRPISRGARQRAPRRNAFQTSFNIPQPATTPILGPQEQSAVLRDMAQDVNTAIRRENDSRVSQLREARRMQHEKELQQSRLDSLLSRLQAAQQSKANRNVVEFPGGRIFVG